MSLMRQMLLLVVVASLLAFTGSLLISLWSAKDYLSMELKRKNNDNANSLALSMTQQKDKDPVFVELQVTALFDTGYYQKVSVVDPQGKPIVERILQKMDTKAPQWFINAFPIESVVGSAQISDGWKQYGTVTVVSHNQFAYDALWAQAGKFMLWFLAGGLIVGAFGTAILRAIGRSLSNVVSQADAIKERRFITIAEPAPSELKAVTRAMNDMVLRVKTMFSEEAGRLDAMRTKANRDAVTGVALRDYFMSHLCEILEGEQFGASGSLVTVRLNIAEVNEKIGHQRANELLKALGTTLYTSGTGNIGQRTGRLKGGEFAVICPTFTNPIEAAKDIHQRLLTTWWPQWQNEFPDLFHVAAIAYHRHQSVADLMARTDVALAKAAELGSNSWYAEEEGKAALVVPADQWRIILGDAVRDSQFSLNYFPVVRCGNSDHDKLLHEEGAIRLQMGAAQQPLSAGDFMPMAGKLNLTTAIDLNVLQLAIAHLRQVNNAVAINFAAETISSFLFRNEIQKLLKTVPELCPRLLFEVPEYGVFRQFDAFRDLARTLQQSGCRIGIEYFGQRFAESDKLSSLGLDYIKVHPSYVRGISSNVGNQEFLKGLCRMAHNLGIEIIALGVESDTELALLSSLGFDGATGPGIC